MKSHLPILLLALSTASLHAQEPQPAAPQPEAAAAPAQEAAPAADAIDLKALAAADQTVTATLGSMALSAKKYDEAHTLLEKAAGEGNPRAQAQLGTLYYNGWGVAQDQEKARELYQSATSGGSREGMYLLGALHKDGLAGARTDVPLAIKLWLQSSKLGEPRATLGLSRIYLRDPAHGDLEAGIALLKEGAERGIPGCLADLAFANEHAIGMPANPVKALELYARAVEAGSEEAPANLGVLYQLGNSVPQDEARARALYQLGIERGSATALTNLAVLNYQAAKTDADKAAAVQQMKDAKEKGSPTAAGFLEKWGVEAK